MDDVVSMTNITEMVVPYQPFRTFLVNSFFFVQSLLIFFPVPTNKCARMEL